MQLVCHIRALSEAPSQHSLNVLHSLSRLNLISPRLLFPSLRVSLSKPFASLFRTVLLQKCSKTTTRAGNTSLSFRGTIGMDQLSRGRSYLRSPSLFTALSSPSRPLNAKGRLTKKSLIGQKETGKAVSIQCQRDRAFPPLLPFFRTLQNPSLLPVLTLFSPRILWELLSSTFVLMQIYSTFMQFSQRRRALTTVLRPKCD